MARPKIGTKVTFSVPTELLKVADAQAELMGLDRYDVIRLAVAQGLVVLRMQYELTTDLDTYKKDLVDLVVGDELAARSIGKKFEASIERQGDERKASQPGKKAGRT